MFELNAVDLDKVLRKMREFTPKIVSATQARLFGTIQPS